MAHITALENEVTVQWIDDKRILFVDVNVETTERMALYDQMMVDYLDMAPDIVDLIIRLPRPKQAPPSLKRLTSYKYQSHPRLGYVIMIGLNLNPMIQFLIASAAKLRRMKMRTFNTFDEAVYFLRSVRHTK
jgi:hypothetical protein